MENESVYIPAERAEQCQAQSVGMLSCSALVYTFYRAGEGGKPELVGHYLRHVQGDLAPNLTPAECIEKLGLPADVALTRVEVAQEECVYRDGQKKEYQLRADSTDQYRHILRGERPDVDDFLDKLISCGVPRENIRHHCHSGLFRAQPAKAGARSLLLRGSRLPAVHKMPDFLDDQGIVDVRDPRVVKQLGLAALPAKPMPVRARGTAGLFAGAAHSAPRGAVRQVDESKAAAVVRPPKVQRFRTKVVTAYVAGKPIVARFPADRPRRAVHERMAGRKAEESNLLSRLAKTLGF
jgi:hypothetical protein